MSTPHGQWGPGGQGQGPSALPDFSSGSAPGYGRGHGAGSGGGHRGGGPDTSDGRSRTPWIVAGVVGGGALLILVVVLILTQTVFRSVLDPVDSAAGPTTIEEQDKSNRPSEEFIPTAPVSPTEAPPPPDPSLTGLPSAPCIPATDPGGSGAQQEPGWVAGGDLRFRTTDDFNGSGWGMSLAYTYDVAETMENVEGSWFSVIGVGGVDFGEEDYDLKTGAEVLMQCYITSGMMTLSGGSVDTTTFSSDPITVDGHDAWMVTTTWQLPDDYLDATDSAYMVVVLVDTGDGYSALFSDVAPNIPEHADAQQFAIDTLEVV